jgi:hypothetical protein
LTDGIYAKREEKENNKDRKWQESTDFFMSQMRAGVETHALSHRWFGAVLPFLPIHF